jgi:hypothetical protein
VKTAFYPRCKKVIIHIRRKEKEREKRHVIDVNAYVFVIFIMHSNFASENFIDQSPILLNWKSMIKRKIGKNENFNS